MASLIIDCQKCIEDAIMSQNIEAYETERTEVQRNILEAIDYGKSSFILLIEQQGSGIKEVVKDILKEITTKYTGAFKKIKMNGYLHENDEVALKHITRKLHSEESIEGEFFGSLDDHVQHVMKLLQEGDETSRPLIFILDEFHAFCENAQLLIHNLLDVVNSKKTPVCIIGMTTNISCLQKLHQRTASRIASNIRILESKIHSKERLKLFHTLLTLENKSKLPKPFTNEWNNSVKKLFSDPEFIQIVEDAMRNQSEEIFSHFMVRCVRSINEKHPTLSVEEIKHVIQGMRNPIDISGHLRNLTIVEQCLMIAICHITCDAKPIRHDKPQSFNFETVHSKFKSVTDKWGHPRVSREVAAYAFNKLKQRGFIALENDIVSETPDFEPYILRVREQIIKDAIRSAPHATPEMREWVDNSLMSQ